MSNKFISNVKLPTLQLLKFFSEYGIKMLDEYEVPSEYIKEYHGYMCIEDNYIYYDKNPTDYVFICDSAKLCSNELFPFLCMLYKLNHNLCPRETLFDKHTIMNIFTLNGKCDFEKLYSMLFTLLRNRRLCNNYLNIDTLEITNIDSSVKHVNHILRIYSNGEINLMTEISIILSHDENVISQLFQSPFNSIIVNKILTNDISQADKSKNDEQSNEMYFSNHSIKKVDVVFNNELLKEKLENMKVSFETCEDVIFEKKINGWLEITGSDYICHKCSLCGDTLHRDSFFDWTFYSVPNLLTRIIDSNTYGEHIEIIVCTKCKSLVGTLHPIEYFIINGYVMDETVLGNLNLSICDYDLCYDNMNKCKEYRLKMKNIIYSSESSSIMKLLTKYMNKLNFISSMKTRACVIDEIEELIPGIIDM